MEYRDLTEWRGLIDNIIKRPGMYIGEGNSIREICNWLHAYCLGASVHGYCVDTDEMEFYEFVADKYDEWGEKGWHQIIREHTDSDDEAFERFKELIQEFREIVGDKMAIEWEPYKYIRNKK